MPEDRLVLEAEARDGAHYITLVRPDGRRILTDVLAHDAVIDIFNETPVGAANMPLAVHELYLALTQEVNSEHWKGSAADRYWALHALRVRSGTTTS